MYQWNAEDYAAYSRGQEALARELLPLLALRDDDHVLDIGCGDGRITAAIARAVPRGRVVGLDLSHDMVRHARATYGDCGPHLVFAQGDAGELRFTEEFSAIFSSATLHWIRDQAPVIAGMVRALRPNGRLVAQFGGYGNTRDVIAAFEEVAARPRWRAAFADFESTYGFYTAEQYGDWLSAAGLDVTEARLIPKTMVHADRNALAGWLRTAWHPYTSPAAAGDRPALIDEVVNDYLSRCPPDANGAIHVALVRLQIQARRLAANAAT